MGYDGSMTILKDYVHPFRPAKTAPAVQRYETEPGKQHRWPGESVYTKMTKASIIMSQRS